MLHPFCHLINKNWQCAVGLILTPSVRPLDASSLGWGIKEHPLKAHQQVTLTTLKLPTASRLGPCPADLRPRPARTIQYHTAHTNEPKLSHDSLPAHLNSTKCNEDEWEPQHACVSFHLSFEAGPLAFVHFSNNHDGRTVQTSSVPRAAPQPSSEARWQRQPHKRESV